MRIAVAGHAVWSLGIAGGRRLSMDALLQLFRFLGVALRTFRQCNLSAPDLMRVAVAGLASLLAKHPMNAAREMFGFLIVTRETLNFRHFGGMGIVFDRPMAVRARQNAVNAGRMPARVNGNLVAAV